MPEETRPTPPTRCCPSPVRPTPAPVTRGRRRHPLSLLRALLRPGHPPRAPPRPGRLLGPSSARRGVGRASPSSSATRGPPPADAAARPSAPHPRRRGRRAGRLPRHRRGHRPGRLRGAGHPVRVGRAAVPGGVAAHPGRGHRQGGDPRLRRVAGPGGAAWWPSCSAPSSASIALVEPVLERPVVAALGRRIRGVRLLLRAPRPSPGGRARRRQWTA